MHDSSGFGLVCLAFCIVLCRSWQAEWSNDYVTVASFLLRAGGAIPDNTGS